MAVAREQLYRVCSHDRRITGGDIVIDAWRKEISEAPTFQISSETAPAARGNVRADAKLWRLPLCLCVATVSCTFRICTPHKPLVSAVTRRQGCWRLIDAW